MLFKTSKFFLHAAVFAVAIVTASTLFPFIVGKYVWFRAMVDLALVFFFAGLIFDPESGHYITRLKQLFRSPVVIAVTAFAAFFVLACFFGVRPSFSFWSNFERGEGGIQILNLYAFFVLLATMFRDDKDWRKMFWLSMGAASLMILYGVIAGFGGSFIGGWGSIGPRFGTPGFRFQGSLGNSEYVPGYLVFMLFFASYLLLGIKRSWRSAQSLGLIALIFIFLLFCLMSGTRGAFIGLIAGVLAAVIYIGIYRKAWRKWLLLGAGLALIGVALLVQFRHVPAIQNIPGASSILRLRLNSADLADLTTRFVMWDTAVQGWKERPLLGWGPENFLMLFDKHYEIRYYNPENGFGAWFDRAHSTIFDYLAQIGILGLLSYLAIFVCLGLLLLQKRWREAAKSDSRRMVIQGLFLGILVTYLVQGTVLFDVFALYLPLFTLFAFAAHYFHLTAPSEKKPQQPAS